MLIVAILGPMTLRTQGHYVREAHWLSVGKVQATVAIEWIMASDTGLSAVIQSKSLVELVEVSRHATLAIGRARRMAMLAGHGDCIARMIAQARVDRGRTLRCADMHRMARGCNRCWFGFGRWQRVMIRRDS